MARLVSLRELDEATLGTNRYIDMCLVLERETTNEVLLVAGGVWDRIGRRYTTDRPRKVRRLKIKESQVPCITYFAKFLKAMRRGEPWDKALTMFIGDRRGGKTWAMVICQFAFLLDIPDIGGSPTISWVVNPSFSEVDEPQRIIKENIPESWYHHSVTPGSPYQLANGGTLRLMSANDPEVLRQGRVDLVGFNEAQKIDKDSMVNAIAGIADKGGMSLLAANPPRRLKGEWVKKLKDAVDLKTTLDVTYFVLSSKDNSAINQSQRRRVAGIVKIINPRASRADDDGDWLPVGDRAYPKWSSKLIEQLPDGPFLKLNEITGKLTADKTGLAYRFVLGADFNGRPHQAAVALRVFEGPRGPIYWFVDEMVVEGTEMHLSDTAYEHKYKPENAIWIPDASGEWQNAKHTSEQDTSYSVLRSQRWNVEPPTEIMRPDKSRYSKNPDVDRRLGLVYILMEQDRIRVNPGLTWLIDSFENCPLGENRHGKRKPYGKHSHITDAADYPLWWLEPKPGEDIKVDTDVSFGGIAGFQREGSPFPGQR